MDKLNPKENPLFVNSIWELYTRLCYIQYVQWLCCDQNNNLYQKAYLSLVRDLQQHPIIIVIAARELLRGALMRPMLNDLSEVLN